MLTVAPNCNVKYSDILKATSSIALGEICITDIRSSRAITGGVVLEISGKDSASKAATLAD